MDIVRFVYTLKPKVHRTSLHKTHKMQETRELLIKPRTGSAILSSSIFFIVSAVLAYIVYANNNRSFFFEEYNLEFIAALLVAILFAVLGLLQVGTSIQNRRDYIRVDSKGITIKAHDNSFIPKLHQCSYDWNELSSYTLDVIPDRSNKKSTIYNEQTEGYTIKLYDSHGKELQNIQLDYFYPLSEMEKLEEFLGSHLTNKIIYDFSKNGKVSFYKRKMDWFIIKFIMVYLLLAGALILTNELFAFTTSTLIIVLINLIIIATSIYAVLKYDHKNIDQAKDSLTIDKERISVNILELKITKNISHSRYHYYFFEGNEMNLYDADKKLIYSFNCSKLENSKYMEMVFKQFLQEKTEI